MIRQDDNDLYPWIFGLSIDEDLRWSAVRIDRKTGTESSDSDHRRKGIICDLPHTPNEVDLHLLIESALHNIKQSSPDIIDHTISIGVSSIGIIDTRSKKLMNIDRKNWKRREDGSLVDFQYLFHSVFTRNDISINVQNDATAKCYAEFRRQNFLEDHGDQIEILCFANFHNGVNCGIVQSGRIKSKPIAQSMHQEIGHIYPPLHKADYNFNIAHSGCPIHKFCYVGVASGERLRKQWGNMSIDELKGHEDNPEDIISHYIANFCWSIVLTLPPQRILLGGALATNNILETVKSKFRSFNVFQGRQYICTDSMQNDDFISLAGIRHDESGVAGALEIARDRFLPSIHEARAV